MGALSQAARHITASIVTRPSAVVSPTLMPRFSHRFFQELVGAAQGARQVRADLHAVLARRLVVVQGVEADDGGDTSVGDVDDLRHILHGLLCEVACLALGEVQQRHDRRALLFRRVLRQDLFDFL
jgi:hypothetical protein